MIKQFAKLMIIAGVLGVAAAPAISVAKTCHQEAKEKGIKDKKEVKKFVHECLEKRKHAKKAMKHKKEEMKKEAK